ncbi:MAG: hypothetical protein II388_09810, partial [Clostridia bacterium]|nr:hypothetical protein [Clostridia bacterium]
MHPFFAAFRIQCVELSVTWFVLGIYIYEKLRIRENTRGFVRLYEEVKIMKVLWNVNQLTFATIGGFIGWFWGGCDSL